MLTTLLATLAGALIGLTAVIPGVHISVLLIGALPLLAITGDTGACLIASSMASGLISTTLAKTFHPATRETINNATPEQTMAYKGQGFQAVNIQLQAIWTGMAVTTLALTPLLLMQALAPKAPKLLFDNLVTPIAPLFVAFFIVSTILQAKRKVLTALVMLIASVIGYTAMNHPSLAGNETSLAPLLAGVFSLPALIQVITHPGKIQKFPKQQPHTVPVDSNPWPGLGALGGMLTAVTAGLGSGAITSSFAGHIPEKDYLAMHTASEAANHVLAILLFILLGVAHAGSAIALKRSTQNPDLTLALMLALAMAVGVVIATAAITVGAKRYVLLVTAIPQRATAVAVAATTIGLVVHETGLVGLVVATAATTLGLAARQHKLPNQALAAVLTGPIIIYHAGLSPALAHLVGIVH